MNVEAKFRERQRQLKRTERDERRLRRKEEKRLRKLGRQPPKTEAGNRAE